MHRAVHYVGTLEADGSEFDSSRQRGTPFEFDIGKGPTGLGLPLERDLLLLSFPLLDASYLQYFVNLSKPSNIVWRHLTGSVIKGWDVGVATMKKGEKAILTCKADYAYGESGSPPKIPGGATLNFEVNL